MSIDNETAGGGGGQHELEVRFTGRGAEYFRIWIVNLLLTIVTLGIYYPWARVRRLKYFYGNTQVGGQALDFHGDPKRMLRGYLLVGALVVLYSVAGQFSIAAGAVALGLIALAAPALLWAAMRFRMANTSWRGLRFRFSGTLAGAYVALLPGVAALAAYIALLVSMDFSPESVEASTPDPRVIATVAVFVLALLAAAPWLWWRMKRYQHDHFVLGQERTNLRAGAAQAYWLALKAAGISLLLAFAVGLVVGLGSLVAQDATLATVLSLVAYLILVIVLSAYIGSRTQNLLWSNTASNRIAIRSDLKFSPMLRVTGANTLLVVLTLGLYWPFAAVALARVRLEAIAVVMRLAPQELRGDAASMRDASGEAAGDLFGIDLGF